MNESSYIRFLPRVLGLERMSVARACVQFISVTQTRSTRSDNEKRRVKNEGKKYRIDYFIFSNFSRFYILLSTRPLFGVYEARRERERERDRETGHAEILRRSRNV